jgi:organic radical activating enzyme
MEKEEPFEEVMKTKEKKGLQSLLGGEGLTNELTKSQKEMLENLKKKGFRFDKPENSDIYERVRINSKEFNESINAWRPKN